ncbi:hypothetical protein VMT65_25660 [Nocardia sp. CDC153]|uniref:hypothetical protein n=1 Tax=Nocardia sp. CDC153 TaxID=3112167 RepID=UPI002DBFE74B|nr:hypothetical protein [Nocardia sp. CDC153]MEC3956446.1 hypothetical protein [Nocardia sp. CDC153]
MTPEQHQRNDIPPTPVHPDGGQHHGQRPETFADQPGVQFGEQPTQRTGEQRAEQFGDRPGGQLGERSPGQFGERSPGQFGQQSPGQYGGDVGQGHDNQRAEQFDAGQLRDQWREVQTRFVDDPKDAVTRADGLVSDALQQLTDRCSRRREELESRWQRGDAADTEEMRQALRGYRELFDQLLGTASGATNM